MLEQYSEVLSKNIQDFLALPQKDGIKFPNNSDEHTKTLVFESLAEQTDDYTRERLKLFPKHERYCLVQDIRNTMHQILLLIITVKKRYYKKTTLTDLDIQIDYFRHLIRLSYHDKYINQKQYKIWIDKVNTLGKLCGGFIKSAER